MKHYIPKPIDTNDIILNDDLVSLTEKLAKNVHDNWAVGRMTAGWTYGPKRNDELKTTPCLMEYEELLPEEKEYDRATAMETLKVILKLGYDIVRRDE